MVQKVVCGLNIEALFNLGERRIKAVKQRNKKYYQTHSATLLKSLKRDITVDEENSSLFCNEKACSSGGWDGKCLNLFPCQPVDVW